MGITRLDHVNIRTRNLAAMVAWYDRVLGFKPGPRPGFPFNGAWLYANGQALVHLVDCESPEAYHKDLQLEHFAFSATGLTEFMAHLRAEKVAYYCGTLPQFETRLVNLHDHDGNHIHVDFPWSEEADLSDYDGS